MQIDLTCQFDSNRINVGREQGGLTASEAPESLRGKVLYAQDHHLSGLDEGSSYLSFFQPQFANGVRRNHRGDLLAAIDSVTWAMMPSTLMSTMRPISWLRALILRNWARRWGSGMRFSAKCRCLSNSLSGIR